MDHYEKGENVSHLSETEESIVQELHSAFPDVVKDKTSKVLAVKAGSKLKNLIPVALNQCRDQHYTIITGFGPGVGKAVSLAEIVKKRVNASCVMQANSVRFTTVEEHWDPKENASQLDPLKVVRNIPFIGIFLTTTNLDLQETSLPAWTKQVNLEAFLNNTKSTKKRCTVGSKGSHHDLRSNKKSKNTKKAPPLYCSN